MVDPQSRKSYFIGMNAIISEKGQVTIPKRIRDELGLKAGVVLNFATRNGVLTARKSSEKVNPFSKWRGAGRLPAGKTVEEYLRIARYGDRD